jgi:xanthine dehydrogenase iron-sulfur cluster and FAD-binding subunit A
VLRPFSLHHPATLGEVGALLHQYGDDAVLYAGGTELLLVMKEGLLRPHHVVDLKRIPDLDVIADADGTLDIGATTRHRVVETAPLVHARCPLLSEVARHVANVRVRSVGTVGGNLAFADPHSDLATLFLALDTSLLLWSSRGVRELPLAQFVREAYQTAREDDEVLTTVRLRPWPPGTTATYVKFGVHERPTLGVAVAMLPATASAPAALRLAVGCVGPVPQRLHTLEAQAMGESPSYLAAHAAELSAWAVDEVEAVDDRHGSAEYKRELTRVFVRRALQVTAARIAGETARPRWAHAVVLMMGGGQIMGGLERAPQAPQGDSERPATPVTRLGPTPSSGGLERAPQAPQGLGGGTSYVGGLQGSAGAATDRDWRTSRITMIVNGRPTQVEIEPHALLLDVLRDRLGLKGAKRSCDIQVCGACTVLVDGGPVSACTYLAQEVDGRDVRTVEGLSDGESLHPLQEAFVERGAVQCGFCTSGMLLSAAALLAQDAAPSREGIVHYLRGNLCRCTGYRKIIDAIADCAASEEARR